MNAEARRINSVLQVPPVSEYAVAVGQFFTEVGHWDPRTVFGTPGFDLPQIPADTGVHI